MKKPRRLLVIGLCITGVFLCLLSVFGRGPRNREPFLAEVPMSDGIHRLRLLKIVEGPLVYDWQDSRLPVLKFLPLPAALMPPIVPFEKVDLDGLAPLIDTFKDDKVPGYSFLFRAVDANGEYASTEGVSDLSFIESTGHVLVNPDSFFEKPGNWGVSAFTRAVLPRRDRQLRIRVKETAAPEKTLEFAVENPAYRPPQTEWVPEPLPRTKTFEGVEVTLHNIQYFGPDSIHGKLTIKQDGWEPPLFTWWLEDVTGNRGTRLSPFEPSWRLHGAIEPRYVDAISASHLWAIDDVAVPAYEVETQLYLEHEIEGVRLRVDKIVGGDIGSGQKDKEDGPFKIDRSDYRPDCPWIQVTAMGDLRDYAVVVQVTSDGERLESGGGTSFTSQSRDIKHVFKKLPANSKVKIEIGIGHPIDVEFLVDPKEFQSKSRHSTTNDKGK